MEALAMPDPRVLSHLSPRLVLGGTHETHR